MLFISQCMREREIRSIIIGWLYVLAYCFQKVKKNTANSPNPQAFPCQMHSGSKGVLLILLFSLAVLFQTGQSFTTTEIGIIAGVVVGVFLALVLVPCCIFSCYVLCRKQVWSTHLPANTPIAYALHKADIIIVECFTTNQSQYILRSTCCITIMCSFIVDSSYLLHLL